MTVNRFINLAIDTKPPHEFDRNGIFNNPFAKNRPEFPKNRDYRLIQLLQGSNLLDPCLKYFTPPCHLPPAPPLPGMGWGGWGI